MKFERFVNFAAGLSIGEITQGDSSHLRPTRVAIDGELELDRIAQFDIASNPCICKLSDMEG
jgi:hypothetical protein